MSLLLLNDPFQLVHVRGGQPVVPDEMGQHRLQGAVETPPEETCSFGLQAVGFTDARVVEVRLPARLESERSFPDQPPQKGFDRPGMPGSLPR